MRAARPTSLATLVCLLAIGLIVAPSAQAPASDEEFDTLMKSVGAAAGALRKGIEARDSAAVAAQAKEMATLQRQNAAFWAARGAQDAVDWANGVAERATEIDRAAAVNNLPGTAEPLKQMMAGCQQCHGKYREKGADGFVIKKS